MKKYFLPAIIIFVLGACKKNDPSPVSQDAPPGASYSANIVFTAGKYADIKPVNRGGAVPATIYGDVTTLAGSTEGASGYVNTNGTAALFNAPQQLTHDSQGNIYVADSKNNAIRKISPDGTVTTFAGSLTGLNGDKDDTSASALFDFPDGITTDAAGNFFVSDYNNYAIRKITPAGAVSTFYQGAALAGANGLCFDKSGNLFVALQNSNQVAKISTAGVLTIIAGSPAGAIGYVNGTGASATFFEPTDVKADAAGNVYVVDLGNNAIRKITPTGVVTTFSGTPAGPDAGGNPYLFRNPSGIAIGPGGVMYVADLANAQVQRIMPDGTVSLVAGSLIGTYGDADGAGSAARFFEPAYISIDDTT
ncbi:MAG: hypothetical protein ABI203_04310 [Mucilaginibacter sp.]